MSPVKNNTSKPVKKPVKKIIVEKPVKKPVKKIVAEPVKTKTIKTGKPKSDIKSPVIAPVYDETGKKISDYQLPSELFQVTSSDILLATYVRVYLANQRRGSAFAQTRAEVTGSTKKIYKQKGTGRARHGARKAPIFVGGGKAFGPRPHSFTLKLNKKQIRQSLLASLSAKAKDQKIIILNLKKDSIVKTKTANNLLKNLNPIGKKACLIYDFSTDDKLPLSFRNIPDITICPFNSVNAYLILKNNLIIFSQTGLDRFIKTKTI